MSDVERDFIKAVDEKILTASQKSLKKLQKLDIETQLNGMTFYDAFANSKHSDKKESAPSPKIFRKSKQQ